MPPLSRFAEHLRFWIYCLDGQRCDGDGVPHNCRKADGSYQALSRG